MSTDGVGAGLGSAARDLRRPVGHRLDAAAVSLEVVEGRDDVWLILIGLSGVEVAIRGAHCPGGCRHMAIEESGDGSVLVTVASDVGEHRIEVRVHETAGFPVVAVRQTLTLERPTVLPFLPRDFYPLGLGRDPRASCGAVVAAQRGVNAGLVFARMDAPIPARVLYVQDLTMLADYFAATGTVPDTAVGGHWPELGYLPPTALERRLPPDSALPAGRPITLSRALIAIDSRGDLETQNDVDRNALSFIQLLAAVYEHLQRPAREYRDWPSRAERTMEALRAPADGTATIELYGCRFARPYVGAEYPDSMVQASLTSAVHEYGKWGGGTNPVKSEMRRGLRKFFDPELGTMRRYLANVGSDKNADAVDSWYQYHPMINLGLLATDGDYVARRLFCDALERAVDVAHHFTYEWPVQFDVRDLSVIVGPRDGEDFGQTDVGGVYAFVMLLASEITGDQEYMREAEAAIDASDGYRFDLNYQANLTAWGAAGCMRLYRVTDRADYRERAYMYLASLLHNTTMWESQIGAARHYGTFMTPTCLHDASYMAAYELFDSVRALDQLAGDCGPNVDEAVRFLVAELCAYSVDRAWYCYPDTLPTEVISTQVRNGVIDPSLSFPLEDLYPSGQLAGMVGQQVYGGGAGLCFAARTHHAIEGAPFTLYCDYLLHAITKTSPRTATFGVDGAHRGQAVLAFVRSKGRRLSELHVAGEVVGEVEARSATRDRVEYLVPPGPVHIRW